MELAETTIPFADVPLGVDPTVVGVGADEHALAKSRAAEKRASFRAFKSTNCIATSNEVGVSP